MLFYKVVEIKHSSMFKGRMSAHDLQNVINQWANIGWALDRIVAGETAHFMGIGSKDVFLLIFKRSIEVPEGLHFMINGQSVPVNDRQLQYLKSQNQISPTTPAIKKGMADWQPLAMVVPELADALATQ